VTNNIVFFKILDFKNFIVEDFTVLLQISKFLSKLSIGGVLGGE